MNCACVFKHLAKSSALRNYASEKVENQVTKYVTKPIGARIIFSANGMSKEARCLVYAGDGFSLSAKGVSEDFYAAVDGMMHKLRTQLKKHKECLKTHHKKFYNRESVELEE